MKFQAEPLLDIGEAARAAALADAIGRLGGPSEVSIVGMQCGAVNDVCRLRTRAGDDLALRIRRRAFPNIADDWLVKSAICAQLIAQRPTGPSDLGTFDARLAQEEADLDLPQAGAIRLHRHGAAPCRPPWEAGDWLEGPLLAARPEIARYAELGRALASLHEVRFTGFQTSLGPGRHSHDGSEWVRFVLRAFTTSAVERAVGSNAADRLRHARVDLSDTPWVLLHGDVHAGNVIATAHGVKIIDWDEASIGPPEFDFAPLKWFTRLDAGGAWVADPALFAAAVEGYRAVGGRLDPGRLALGELLFLMKRLQGCQEDSAEQAELASAIVTLADKLPE